MTYELDNFIVKYNYLLSHENKEELSMESGHV